MPEERREGIKGSLGVRNGWLSLLLHGDSGSDSGPHFNCIPLSPSLSEVSIEPPTAALTTVEETDTLVSDLGDHVSAVAIIDKDMSGVGTFMALPTPALTPVSTPAHFRRLALGTLIMIVLVIHAQKLMQ